MPIAYKLTNEASLLRFDYRCKVDGKYIIIDMQQWYKQGVVQRFYLYHAANLKTKQQNLENEYFLEAIQASPETIIISKELSQEKLNRLHTYLQQLPSCQKEVLHLRFFKI